MNLFFSSLAMRAAKARPIPEEHPVMRTTFWFMVWTRRLLWSSEKRTHEPHSSVAEIPNGAACCRRRTPNPHSCNSAQSPGRRLPAHVAKVHLPFPPHHVNAALALGTMGMQPQLSCTRMKDGCDGDREVRGHMQPNI